MPAGGGLLQWWFDVPCHLAGCRRQSNHGFRDRFARWQPPMRDLLDVISNGDIEPFPHGGIQCPDGYR
jgi:hypothetical protein